MALAIFATFSWIGYGALRHDFAVLITNLFVGTGQLIVLRALIYHRKLQLHWVLGIALACSALIILARATDPAVVGLSASLLGVLNLIPQVREAVRSDRLDGISVMSYVLFVVAVVSWIGYALAHHDYVVLGANILVLPLALVVLARILQTRKNAILEAIAVDDCFAAA